VVVDPTLAPKAGLVAEDIAAGASGRVGRAVEDAIWVRIAGGEVAVDEAVVAAEGGAVIVPMGGHGERIGDEGAEQQALAAGVRWDIRDHRVITLGRAPLASRDGEE